MNVCGQHHAPAALPTEISVVTKVEASCALETFPEKGIISCSCRNLNSRLSNPKKKQQLFPNSYFPNIINGLSSDKDGACSLCGRKCILTVYIVGLISPFEVLGRKIERKDFLGPFAKLRKRLLASPCLSVRPSARLSLLVEKLSSHWTDFHEIRYLSIFRETAEKIQVSLKSNKSNGYMTTNTNF